jgi:pimeloyl-ACP methyl ester carboxylesterase
MKERVHLSKWKSAGAEQRFRDLEDELVRDLVAEPPTPIDVTTRLGPTRAYRWDGEGLPIVFLHGTAGTSLTWARYAEHRRNRVMYAIDTIGDVGRSHQHVAVENAEDLAEWLDEALAALGLGSVHLAGTSYGAFLALNLAARRPARVSSLVLIDPAGIVRPRLLKFMVWGTSALFASLLSRPLRTAAARRLRMPALEDKRLLRVALYGQLHHRSRLLPADPLSDGQLRAIDQPILLIAGAKSEVFPATEVQARAEAQLPRAEVDIVPGAGHAVAVSHVEHITERLDSFLERQDAQPNPEPGSG